MKRKMIFLDMVSLAPTDDTVSKYIVTVNLKREKDEDSAMDVWLDAFIDAPVGKD